MREDIIQAKNARSPVVLVHGIWNTAGIFAPLQTYLELAGWTVYAPSLTPNNGDAPLEALAEQVASFVEDALGSQQPFNLVGFSMGGLISRYYVQRLGGLARVQQFVTVSAPHQGTLLGLFSHRYGIRQMRPGSLFLSELNGDIHQLKNVQFFSLWTPFDLLILPPWSSDLSDIAIGRSHKLKVSSHNRMIFDPLGIEAIAHHLSASSVA
ncbi:MAG: triacylglycerol lipase [Phormidesmis sp.]